MHRPNYFTSLFLICSYLISIPASAQQIADSAFFYMIKDPVHRKGEGTTIVLDEAHHNFHTLSGRYYAFGKHLENDGYILKPGLEKLTSGYLSPIKIFVIANALPDTGKWALPVRPAFSDEEVMHLQHWVSEGGSLLLIADHMPFPGAVQDIGLAFGFNFINGFAVRKDNAPEVFSISNHLLTTNAITKGRNQSESVDSVMFFTGQGFLAPKEATVISKLNDDYEIYLTSVAWEVNDTTPVLSGLGYVNGAYMEYGKGRIVIMGEAAMFSAQLAGADRRKMGMNYPDAKQNPQFLLNIIHWLDRKI